MKKRIIITGGFRFPDGDAASARVLGTAKALQEAGYVVSFAGWEDHERPEDKQLDGRYRYQGFEYVSQQDLREQKLSPLRRLIRYLLMGRNTLSWLKSSNLDDVSAIIAYHGTTIFLLRLMLLCFKRDIKLFFDCTEWYDSRHLVGGRFGIVSIDNMIRMRVINRMIGQGIVISSYLKNYYKNLHVIMIPPLIDMHDPKWTQSELSSQVDDHCLELVYAGTPAKKDLIGNALYGLKQLKSDGYEVRLHLLGPSRAALLACVDGDEALLEAINDQLVFHGRVPQVDVPRIVGVADFSVLLRPQERYAQAGFSTKFVESLMAGVPVISNKTGDVAKFVEHDKEAILIDDYSPEAFVSGVKHAMKLSHEQRLSMRVNARDLAEKRFDFREYVQPLTVFLS
jgi:glycosyltransferase involved in cell wall biosynthesis